jgi:hypothetical protein
MLALLKVPFYSHRALLFSPGFSPVLLRPPIFQPFSTVCFAGHAAFHNHSAKTVETVYQSHRQIAPG